MSERLRALFVGDNHVDVLRPINRRDDYFQATLAELRECLQVGIERGVDVAVLLGDLFNRVQPGGECVNAVMEILKEAKERGLRVVALVGNHDIDVSPANYPRSALRAVEIAGFVEVPRNDEWYGEIPELGIGLTHFTPVAHLDLAAGSLRDRPMTIHAAHCSITLGPWYKNYVEVDDIPTSPRTRLLVAGHIHTPMRKVRDDGLQFVNPGSVCRKTLSAENLVRDPSVLIVEYERGGQVLCVEDVRLSSCRPAREVFFVAEGEGKKERAAERKQRVIDFTEMGGWDDEGGDRYAGLEASGLLKGVGADAVAMAVEELRRVHQTTSA